MKTRINSKKLVAAMLATTMIMATGCGKSEDDTTATTTSQPEVTTEATTNQTENADVEETTGNTEETTENLDTSSDVDYMTTKGFIPLSQAIEFYEFEKDENEDSMFIYADSTYRGEYRLCSDAKDIITVDFDYDANEGYIEVNDVKSTFYASAISNVAIIDIDKNDSYKEVAIYDEGPSADPTIILYRYCDGELYNLGEFCGRYDFDYVLFDQQGRIIDAEGYIEFLDTQIVASYYDIEDNNAVKVLVDLSGALNQKYRVSRDIMVAFNTSKEDIYDLDNLITIKAGEEIVLIEAYESLVEFCIELPDGTRGYITTQIAG